MPDLGKHGTYKDIIELYQSIQQVGFGSLLLPYTAYLISYKSGNSSALAQNLRPLARKANIVRLKVECTGLVSPYQITINGEKRQNA